jgi:hypothetical protein
MEPKKVGRALGIGVRVASKMVRERVEQGAAQPPTPVAAGVPPPPARARTSSWMSTFKRGAKAFVQAFLGPFTHAGGVLWLEITGLFFALFALFFVQSVYRVHTAWSQGPEHAHLLLYCVLAIAFAWFSVSSFTRAYRKSKRGPHTRP